MSSRFSIEDFGGLRTFTSACGGDRPCEMWPSRNCKFQFSDEYFSEELSAVVSEVLSVIARPLIPSSLASALLPYSLAGPLLTYSLAGIVLSTLSGCSVIVSRLELFPSSAVFVASLLPC